MTMQNLAFRIKGIHHIALVPREGQKAYSFFADILQLTCLGAEEVAEQEVRTLMMASSHEARGKGEQLEAPRLEILESLSATSPIENFRNQKGGGIHHIAFEVDSLIDAIACLKQQGVEFIDHQPRSGAHGSQIAFIHPRSSGGILCELVELP